MKTSYLSQLLCIAASALTWNVAHAHPSRDWGQELVEFETRFISTMAYKLHNDSIKLIGYKKIEIPQPERFWQPRRVEEDGFHILRSEHWHNPHLLPR